MIDLLKVKLSKKQRKKKGKTSELIIIIFCQNEQIHMVEKILWDNLALGVAKLDDSFTEV